MKTKRPHLKHLVCGRFYATALTIGLFSAVFIRPTTWVYAEEASDVGLPRFQTGYADVAPTDGYGARSPQQTLFEHGDPTPYEQLMLELINRTRAAPAIEAARLGIDLNAGLPAGTISDAPKQPLSFHPLLINAARAHSQWMLDTDTFSHTGAGGTSPGDRMVNAGYVFSGSWTWGENIAWGGSTGSINIESQTRARHESLFRSSGHRQNICHAPFDEIGLGLLEGLFTTMARTYNALMVTQKYAKSGATPNPRVLGVVYIDADRNTLYDIGEGVAGVQVTIQGGNWRAVSSSSGGYALPYSGVSGMMRMKLDGGPLPLPVTLEIQKTGANIKVDLEIVAAQQMQVLACRATVTGDGFQFVVDGHENLAFDLLYSTDLVEWIIVGQYTFENMPKELTHQPSNSAPAHFYRLRWRE